MLQISTSTIVVRASYEITQTQLVQVEISRNANATISCLTDHYHINAVQEVEHKQSLQW